jgi:hypothetical protein
MACPNFKNEPKNGLRPLGVKQHKRALKLWTTYMMTFMYFLVNIHIYNQSTLYKVNAVPDFRQWTTIAPGDAWLCELAKA